MAAASAHMHSSLSRKVKLPGGTTEPFGVERGVAQGAVESPLLYTTFIDGLALALKRAGYGVWIAGQQVPLLLYADDVVLISALKLPPQPALNTFVIHHDIHCLPLYCVICLRASI